MIVDDAAVATAMHAIAGNVPLVSEMTTSTRHPKVSVKTRQHPNADAAGMSGQLKGARDPRM
jgi:hypothetical protein